MTADDTRIHDIVGIGIGPFGLGLAALADPLDDVDAVFIDQREEFRWHPGMMIEGATVQVPFLADLVTMADPTSRFSFLQFLKDRGRLYPFYIRESFYPLRAEFDEYCRWVAAQLETLRWGRRVTSVAKDDDIYIVTAEVVDGHGQPLSTETYRARHLVLGVGTSPVLPEALRGLGAEADEPRGADRATADRKGEDLTGREAGPVIHTSQYLENREALLESGSITIVGSGQSAAEIYRDLIDEAEGRDVRLDWITRSPRFFPMEYTKLTLEMTSPEYTDHFRDLPDDLREQVGREQRTLYKGISAELVDDIHDALYRLSRGGRRLRTNLVAESELLAADHDSETGEYVLNFRNTALEKTFNRRSGSVVSATGYRSQVPDFLAPLGDEVRRDAKGRLDVARHYTINDEGTIHVLNGEEHTHGVTAPDLGFGPWRASVVLSHVTGREPYPIEDTIAFQTFGIPDDHGAIDDQGAIGDHGAIDHGAIDHRASALEEQGDFESSFAFASDATDTDATTDADASASTGKEMSHV